MTMKNKIRHIYSILVTVLFIFTLQTEKSFASGGYEIKIHINGMRDSTIYLGNHYGEKQYVRDTLKLDQDGWATFKGNDSLPGGIYLIVMPSKTYFEIIVNEQKFTIETDTIDFIKNMKISGSLENKLFNDHQRYIIEKTKSSQEIKAI